MIFDEAHNVAGAARESATVEFSLNSVFSIRQQLDVAAEVIGAYVQMKQQRQQQQQVDPLIVAMLDSAKPLRECDKLQGFAGRLLAWMGRMRAQQGHWQEYEYGKMCRCAPFSFLHVTRLHFPSLSARTPSAVHTRKLRSFLVFSIAASSATAG